MYNYDDVFNQLNGMEYNYLIAEYGIFILVIAIISLIVLLIIYILQSIAIYKLSEKNNIPNSWLAWLPVGNMYILGKLGFEVYAPDDKKNEVFKWVLLGCSAASFVFSDFSEFLSNLAGIGVLVFSVWAYYYIFNKINNKNAVLFTVLSAILSIGGVILFLNRNSFTNEEEYVEDEDEIVFNKTVKKEKTKYCAYCGNKVGKTSNFCSKCGNEL